MSQLQNNTKNRECKHLSFAEREIIEKSLRAKESPREIAAKLFRSKSTITQEIKRGLITYPKANPYFSRNPDVPDVIEVTEYDAITA